MSAVLAFAWVSGFSAGLALACWVVWHTERITGRRSQMPWVPTVIAAWGVVLFMLAVRR